MNSLTVYPRLYSSSRGPRPQFGWSYRCTYKFEPNLCGANIISIVCVERQNQFDIVDQWYVAEASNDSPWFWWLMENPPPDLHLLTRKKGGQPNHCGHMGPSSMGDAVWGIHHQLTSQPRYDTDEDWYVWWMLMTHGCMSNLLIFASVPGNSNWQARLVPATSPWEHVTSPINW